MTLCAGTVAFENKKGTAQALIVDALVGVLGFERARIALAIRLKRVGPNPNTAGQTF